MLRKTGEGSYAHIHPVDKPDDPEKVRKASENVAKEALEHAKRIADEHDLDPAEIAVDAGNILCERAFELADEKGLLVIEERGPRLVAEYRPPDEPE